VKWLDNSLIVGWVQYVLCLSQADYVKELKRLNVESPTSFLIEGKPATTHFFHLKDDKHTSCAIVCLGDMAGRTPIDIAALLVHEAVHIWQQEVDMMGEEAPGWEIEAYAIQRISTNLMRAYAEMTS
jgi:hypothetical protein